MSRRVGEGPKISKLDRPNSRNCFKFCHDFIVSYFNFSFVREKRKTQPNSNLKPFARYLFVISCIFLACIIFGFCGIFNMFSLAILHDRVPKDPPLPDVVLDHLDYKEKWLNVSEYLLSTLTISCIILLLLHKHR